MLKSIYIAAALGVGSLSASAQTAQNNLHDSALAEKGITQWEYTIKTYQVPGINKQSAEFLSNSFNGSGAERWELVSLVDDGRGSMMVVFKRPKQDT